ncbi:YqjD family protein [Massilia sp. KIM]|uniref:DUF883 family protein n=1 Tax=Massilia sp. KIM TaxID=1955422 RepID=UPI00098F5377|nr:DUF883 family protein [Massilia sp. KIM]
MQDTYRSSSNGSVHPISGATYATQSDMKALVRDAQSMLTAAANLTGEKAEELRNRGMEMLDRALGKASYVQGQAMEKSKELAHTADVYVRDNPWRTMAVAAGIGILLGVLLSRNSDHQ